MAMLLFARIKRLALLSAATLLLFGCTPYELRTVLDGPQGKGLSINSPAVVATSSTLAVTASGGVGPYTYTLLSGPTTGSIDPVTGLYTAPATAGTAVIQVTDKTGKSVDATVTVEVPPDYAVSFPVLPADIPWSGVVGGVMSNTGTTQITIRNGSPNPGHANITWSVYLSTNNVLDVGDTLVQQGTIGPMAGLASTTVTFAGTWPAASGAYYLIAAIQSADDSNVADNVVIGHVTAIGDYRYQEGAEVNSGVGPYPGTLSASTTSDSGLNGALNLGAGKTLVVEGVIGTAGQYNTYRLTLSAGLSNMNVQSFWATGFDDIDTVVWDSTIFQYGSTGPGIDMEPAPIGSFNIPTPAAGVWYVGENFFLAGGPGSTGRKYVILIKGLP